MARNGSRSNGCPLVTSSTRRVARREERMTEP
jgi:hypothetical protein